MSPIEHAEDDWQPRPGEPHPIDKAFYDLTVKERDYERVKVDRLERQLARAVDALAEIANGSRWTAIQTRAHAVAALEAMGVDPYAERKVERPA